jgi:signal transduction histidine kinase
VRVRLTVAAVLAVGAALVVGGFALVAGVRSTMRDQVRDATTLDARALAATIDHVVDPADLTLPNSDEHLAQVIDRDGHVIAATPFIEGLPPLTRAVPGRTETVSVPREDDPFVAAVASARDGTVTVVAARTTEPAAQSATAVTRLLLFGLPLLLLLIGGLSWYVIGRALAPVEAITDEVERIGATALHRRVPVPRGDDEIAHLARTTNHMLDRLERAQRRQVQFVSDASHELRSPVATIRQHAEVALAHPDRVSTTDLAQTVLAEDLRVQHLVDDLLLLARADEDAVAPRRRAVDVDDLLFDEARRLRDTTSHEVATSHVTACRVDGDEMALRRVIRNLADNAQRHARHRVSFSSCVVDGEVVVAIDDDGPGIPVGERERVFERFVRLDDARSRDGGGSGLGLAVAAGLVHAHAGTITATDSPLGGARLEFRLQMRR